MAFDDKAVARIVQMARTDGIDPAALLAVAEVESAGRPLERDGVTPRFLFERHVFYRALNRHNRAKLPEAVTAGLALRKWNRRTQYRDQGTHRGRMAALTAARSIDEECANKACSWGLGQILGVNAESLGYDSATAMVNAMVQGGVPGQVEAMLRFVRKNGLIDKLNLHDWAGFARRYNGPAYAANRYDVKMAAAHEKWAAKLDRAIMPDAAPPEPDEPIDDLPPPYVEPKTPEKSTTLWSVVGTIISSLGVHVGNMLADWRIIAIFAVLIVLFALWIGRERLRKIIDEAV